MLELNYDKKVHLDKWNIDVTPYITIENMGAIINDLINCKYGLERDMRLMADILVACTDIYDNNEDANYTYEEILYSGLWDDILNSCPYLAQCIDIIKAEVKDMLSVERSLIGFIDSLTAKVQEMDMSKIDTEKITEVVAKLYSKIGE